MASSIDDNDANKATGNDGGGEAAPQHKAHVSDMYYTNEEPNNPLPLDWTKMGAGHDDTPDELPVRCPHEVADWHPEDTEVVIVGTSGQKITILGDDFANPERTNLSEMTTLVLRSHLIKEMSGLDSLTKLETLELYDNMVQTLDEESLKGCGRTMRILDMSYNAIRNMAPVQYCNGETLTELYLANNKLKEISGLKHLKNLRKLDLGANKLRVLKGEELSGLVNLEELWVGKNKIETLDGIKSLTKLKRLDVQSNRLTSVVNEADGLCYLNPLRENLEELYLAHNGLDDDGISGLISLAGRGGSGCNFPKLTVLDLNRNRLTTTAPLVVDSQNDDVFGEWPMLEELWLSGNDINDFDAVCPLKDASGRNHLPVLETIYLEYNPVAKDFEYRKRLAEFLPILNQIDATRIRGHGSVPVPVGNGIVFTTEEKLRKLQAAAIQRAKEQSPTDA